MSIKSKVKLKTFSISKYSGKKCKFFYSLNVLVIPLRILLKKERNKQETEIYNIQQAISIL